jgi:hypothetical protein
LGALFFLARLPAAGPPACIAPAKKLVDRPREE